MIKNYTSTVPAIRSISYIEHQLVSHGARDIMKRYGTKGELSEVCFTIEDKGIRIPFLLPARVERVEQTLIAQIKRPRADTQRKIKEQAERTAWKLLSDWVDIQMSLIELGQVEFVEVFLPYIYDATKQQTFFERFREDGYKLLTQGER